MKILPEQMRLYAVTDRTWLHGRNLIDVVSEAIDGGATFVQLREKNHLEGMELSGEELLAEAKKLAQLCHERGVLFVIDDDVELALEAGADGVHVGQEDMAAKKARALLGPDKILGVSAHNPEESKESPGRRCRLPGMRCSFCDRNQAGCKAHYGGNDESRDRIGGNPGGSDWRDHRGEYS